MSRYLVSQAERSHKDFFKKNNNSSQRELGPPVGCAALISQCVTACMREASCENNKNMQTKRYNRSLSLDKKTKKNS